MKQGWEIKKLGEVCTFCSGYTPKGNELNNEGLIPYFKVSDMNHRENIKYLTHTTLFLERGCKVYPKHTIVFPKNGAAIATNKKRILQEDSVIDLNTAGVIADKSIVYHEYLYLYLLGLDFRQYTRGGAVPTLDIAELKNKQIPVPSLVEQERIVAELDCLSGVIEKKKQQLKELDALAQSIFYEMFGDPITNEKGWEVKKWEDVLSIVNGKNQKIVENPNGEYPIYGSGGVMGYADKYLCPKNTVIIGRKGNINKPILVKEPFWNVDTAFGLISDKINIDSYFLFFFCRIFNFEQLNKAVTIPSLTKSDLLKINMVCPPLSLQQAFASKIEAIEKKKELIKQSIKEVETLFNSRMDYYFN